METIRVVIIDDEKKCISLLQKMLSNSFPDAEVVGTATDPLEGMRLIRAQRPGLVFLDIEMPNKTGFEVLEATMDVPYKVIFTTAYQQYAIKAIRFSALDYLLKPIDPDELNEAMLRFNAIQKEEQRDKQIGQLIDNIKNPGRAFTRLSIPTSQGVIFIDTASIIYCEASGGYTFFCIKGGEKLITSKTMKDYEEVLPASQFLRIHHSYLINITELKRYIKGEGGVVVMSNNAELPVSKRKKDEFLKHINL